MRDCGLPLFDLRVLITLRFLEPPFLGEGNKAPNTVIEDSFSGESSKDVPVIILIGLRFQNGILNGEYIT